MKFPFIFFLFFISSIAKAQNEKPIQYFDVDGSKISIQLYKFKSKYNANGPNYLTLRFENDSILAFKLFYRKNYGKLSLVKIDTLNSFLNRIYNNNHDNSKFVIIQYYPGLDSCNAGEKPSTGNRYYKKYLKKLKKNFPHEMYWIYKGDENLENQHRNRLDWKLDHNRTIESLFFNFHFPCYSFVIIAPNGNYISIFGEYGKQDVIEVSEEMKATN